MLPTFKPYDLLSATSWDAALFTTFSLSLSFFEAVPLHALRRAGARDIAVITDIVGYSASLSEAGAADVGRRYGITPLEVPQGCFHAKIGLLHGKDGLRATVGSGNLTFGGWGRNIEVTEYLSPSEAPAAFGDLAEFLDLLDREVVDGRLRAPERSLDLGRFAERCRTAARTEGDGRTRVLHSLRDPIADQLAAHADELGGAIEINVVSPFFGSPEAVLSLGRKLACKHLRVCVTERSPEFFDFMRAELLGQPASPVQSEAFDGRLLHAKIVEIVCRKGRLTLSGSANATAPALITAKNVEASVLRIVDTAITFGWRPGHARPLADGEGGSADASTGPCLSAHLDGHRLRGRLFGLQNAGGAWEARGVSGALHVRLPEIVVDAEGVFELAVSLGKDLAFAADRAIQLVLARGEMEVRGWIVFDHLLGAVRERGALAEAMIRALAGGEEPEDLRIILSFFAANPTAFMTDDPGASPSSSPNGSRVPTDDPLIDLALLQPGERGTGLAVERPIFGGLSAFERLLSSMRRYVKEAAAPRRTLQDADDEEVSEGIDPEQRSIPRWCVEAAARVFFGFVEACTDESFRRHAVDLLDFLLFAADRVDETDELKSTFLRDWRTLARRACAVPKPDALDRSYVAVLVARVVADKARANDVHGLLQAWCRGEVDPAWFALAAPIDEGIREDRLAPASQHEWDEAGRLTLRTTTAWSVLRQVQLALEKKVPLPTLPAELKDEAALLERIVGGRASTNKVLVVDASRRHRACPRCGMVLLGKQADKLRTYRIASCCGRVLLDPALE